MSVDGRSRRSTLTILILAQVRLWPVPEKLSSSTESSKLGHKRKRHADGASRILPYIISALFYDSSLRSISIILRKLVPQNEFQCTSVDLPVTKNYSLTQIFIICLSERSRARVRVQKFLVLIQPVVIRATRHPQRNGCLCNGLPNKT